MYTGKVKAINSELGVVWFTPVALLREHFSKVFFTSFDYSVSLSKQNKKKGTYLQLNLLSSSQWMLTGEQIDPIYIHVLEIHIIVLKCITDRVFVQKSPHQAPEFLFL